MPTGAMAAGADGYARSTNANPADILALKYKTPEVCCRPSSIIEVFAENLSGKIVSFLGKISEKPVFTGFRKIIDLF